MKCYVAKYRSSVSSNESQNIPSKVSQFGAALIFFVLLQQPAPTALIVCCDTLAAHETKRGTA